MGMFERPEEIVILIHADIDSQCPAESGDRPQ